MWTAGWQQPMLGVTEPHPYPQIPPQLLLHRVLREAGMIFMDFLRLMTGKK